MAKKVTPEFAKKYIPFLGGVVLCLFSVVLVFNIGYPARVLTFPFAYLFGIASYGIYGIAYAIGFSFLIRNKGFKVKRFSQIVAIVIAFFGICIFMSATSYGKVADYKATFDSLKYITNKQYINFITSNLGGGFVGFGFVNLFAKAHVALAYIVAILLILFAAVLFFIDKVKAFFVKDGKAKPKNKPAKKVKEPSEDNYREIQPINYRRIENYDVINEASQLDTTPVRPMPTASFNPQPAAAPLPKPNSFFSNTAPGVLTRAFYVRPGMGPVAPAPQPAIQQAMVAPINKVEEELSPEEILLKSNQEQTKAEQLELDFSEPKLDEQLVAAQPVFLEPEEPVVAPQPTLEAPKEKKKPIKWIAPSSELLENLEVGKSLEKNTQVAEQRMEAINEVFNNFNVGAKVVSYVIGPSVTRYNIQYDPHVSARSVSNLVEDISIRLGGVLGRFEAIVEGLTYSGLEIPNAEITPVSFKEVYEALPDVKKHPTAVAFGKNIQGDVVYADFNEFPHCLVAGTTGSGKSIFIHSLITTLIMRNSPDNLRLIIVDPKRVEMTRYRDIPHLLCPIVTEPKEASLIMSKLVEEMNERYDKFADADGSTNLKEYNEWAEEHQEEKIPTIIVIVDEFGDLVKTNKEISNPILLLSQKARACGIHMLLSTQSPTTDIITGPIKSNLPTHIALCTANSTQSVTVLGEGGAETLLGKGDMLVQSPIVSRTGLKRVQGCYIQKKETSRVTGYLKEHYECIYDPKFLNLEEAAAQEGQAAVSSGSYSAAADLDEEKRYQSIKQYVMANQYMSMSKIQGDCAVGFNRARRFFNRLQQEGVIGTENEGNKGCRVLIHDEYAETPAVSSEELTY